jgi:putative transport protein
MFDWFAATLKQYPEIAIFLTLAIGYYFGKFTIKGIGLGSVTATLLAGVVIGQIGITINQPLKATVFLMFLFAVGYGVGPQFVRGVAKDGLPQAIFSAVQCVFSLIVPVMIVKFVGYDLGIRGRTLLGVADDLRGDGPVDRRDQPLGLTAEQTKALLDSMPIAYAVTYMFGTMGSAVVIAVLGPKLLGINLEAACKDYEQKQGGVKELGGPGTAWRRWEARAYRVAIGGKAVGLRVGEAEALVPDARVFVLRVRHNGAIEEATVDTVLHENDVLAVAGARETLVQVLGANATEVEDRELLAMPIEGRRRARQQQGRRWPHAGGAGGDAETRGVFLRKIVRGATATVIPILPTTTIQRGDLFTIAGRTQDTTRAIKLLGVADRQTDVTDMAFVGLFIVIGALDRLAGLQSRRVPPDVVHGGRRARRRHHRRVAAVGAPELRRVPTPTLWFMNSVGLNIFIAIVGISAGPGSSTASRRRASACSSGAPSPPRSRSSSGCSSPSTSSASTMR